MSVKSISLDCVTISISASLTSVAETIPIETINDANKINQITPFKFITLLSSR